MKAVIIRICKYIALLTLTIFCITGFIYLIPSHQMVKESFADTRSDDPNDIPNEYLETDVAELISIEHPSDIARLRHELVLFLWGTANTPSFMPADIINNHNDQRYHDISSLNRIDKITVEMEFGLESHAYHFKPKHPNNNVVLYHQGHRGDFYNSKVQIEAFLTHGYSVVAFSMPLLGLNNQPTIHIPRLGKLTLTNHDHIKFLSPKNGHPVKYFVEPVIVVLNYLSEFESNSTVSMVGISGGGWTTTLAAAIDDRIKYSFPVAGSYPIYLRSNSQRDWGDYEQTVPELYTTVNYLELYILGSYGENRKQLQIINLYDSCCFAGMKWKTYKDIVRKRVQQLGVGDFDLFLDDSHKDHLISEMALRQIFDKLRAINNP